MSKQTPNAVLMIRPAAFGYNIETAASNAFQFTPDIADTEIHQLALQEFDKMVEELRSRHIEVIVIEDTVSPVTPDAIFPNNWFTTHHDGTIVCYPMEATNRRNERRQDVIDQLKLAYEVSRLHDISASELDGKYLEGTGSMVLDHIAKKAYACRSSRTDLQLLIDLCAKINYEPVIFTATDMQGMPIYHTNVMMCIGSDIAIVCLESIAEEDQERVIDQLQMAGKQLIAIGYEQMMNFAGNMLEVENPSGERFLTMSTSAYQSLVNGQINAITKSVDIIEISIPTIEQYGGGGVRCMMAGIHMQKK